MKNQFTQIETQQLGKHYQGRWALKNVSLRFESGQITLLLGPNGAGKSTLLWLLSSLHRPDQGKILYDGISKENIPPLHLRSNIGMLTHESWCYPQLTAMENLLFFGSLYGQSNTQVRFVAKQLLIELELIDASHRLVRTFSRGMLQRLALAKTFLHSPGIVLLDEPYSGIDDQGKQHLTKRILLAKQQGAIVILATHDLAEIAPYCDQAAVLAKGKLTTQAYFRGECSSKTLFALSQGNS